jgi:uncharacterized protein
MNSRTKDFAIKMQIIRALYWLRLFLNKPSNGIFASLSYHFKKMLQLWRSSKPLTDPRKFGLEFSPVSFPSRDGLNLRGWWFGDNEKRPVVIMLHGINANRSEPEERVFGITKELINHGYHILVFDLRAHGESDGSYISAGYFEKNDLLGAVDYIRRRGVKGKIGVLGFSMGAAISLLGAAETKEISAVVADSAFMDIVSLIRWKFSRWRYVLRLFIPAILLAIKNLYHVDLSRIKPIEAIKQIQVPVFIIHGGMDGTIPVEHAYKLRSACRNRNNQFWIIPEARHTDAFSLHREEYLAKILSFFNRSLTPIGC